MLNQKEGVFNAIISVVGAIEGNHVSLDKTTRSKVADIITEGLMNGEISITEEARLKYDTEKKLRTDYVPGLVNNWLRKDIRLNGGDKYVPKNPGSRAGQGDEVLKNLRALKSSLTEASHKAAVDSEIEKRVSEIASSRMKNVEVDMSKIPDDLKSKLGIE